MHYWEKVITVLIVKWPLTTAPVIIVKSGATYADEMDVWWRMNHLQPCVIHAMLLATQMKHGGSQDKTWKAELIYV